MDGNIEVRGDQRGRGVRVRGGGGRGGRGRARRRAIILFCVEMTHTDYHMSRQF